MNKTNVLIALLLVVAMGFMGVMVYTGKAYEAPKGTAASSTTSDNVKEPETAAPAYSVEVDILPGGQENIVVRAGTSGYYTSEGITYFYKYYDFPDIITSAYVYGSSYGSYQNVFKVSYDGRNWKLLGELCDLEFPNFAIPKGINSIYISYCTVSNCEDPEAVLQDLERRVFSNKTYYSVTLSQSIGDEPVETPGEE